MAPNMLSTPVKLPEGLPGLITLILAFLSSAFAAHRLIDIGLGVSIGSVEESNARNRVRKHCFANGYVACIFWIWSVCNNASAGYRVHSLIQFDFGTISWLFLFSASIYGYNAAGLLEVKYLNRQKCFFPSASLLLAVNYFHVIFLLPKLSAEIAWMYIYVVVGFFTFFGNALMGIISISAVKKYGARRQSINIELRTLEPNAS